MTKGKNSDGPKRSQVANACMSCRSSKVKCTGKHPTCSRCRNRGIECQYDVSEEGMTKRQHLHQELSEQKQELVRATAVLSVLQHGTDEEATATLARLRLGQSVDDEFSFLETKYRQQSQRDTPFSTAASPSSPTPVGPTEPVALAGDYPKSPSFPEHEFSPSTTPPQPSSSWSHSQIGLEDSLGAQDGAWGTQTFAEEDSQPMSWTQAISPTVLSSPQQSNDQQTMWIHGYTDAPATDTPGDNTTFTFN